MKDTIILMALGALIALAVSGARRDRDLRIRVSALEMLFIQKGQ